MRSASAIALLLAACAQGGGENVRPGMDARVPVDASAADASPPADAFAPPDALEPSDATSPQDASIREDAFVPEDAGCGSGARCGGECVDTSTSAMHCGGCGRACPTGATCTAGTCACPAGRIECSGACVDPMTSAMHCGGCDNACTGGRVCSTGTCGCAAGTACGGACVDLSTDASHCGGCGNACGSGEVCAGGGCGEPISWLTSAILHDCASPGVIGSRHRYACPAGGLAGSLWGTDVYTHDSSICTAAVHAGRITLAAGGAVTIEMAPGQSSYPSSTRNGITSSSWGSWHCSFRFVP